FIILLILNPYTMAQNTENKNINYFENDGNKIYYRDMGCGNTTIVLVSGGTLGLETWESFQEQLSNHARVISYDRSGLGNSDYVPDSKNIGSMTAELDKVIHKLGVDTPVILVGHSVGGYIVRKYTELFPQKVKALFLIDAYHELFYKELKEAVTEEMWSNYINNWKNLVNHLPPGAADEVNFNLEGMESGERYPLPSDIPVYLFTSIKEVEIEERFIEFNNRAFEVHLRLNKQLENTHTNLQHVITDKSSHFIYLDEPELIMNEIFKTINK
ncbi:MAG: alpha/beta hydrolase, partial [Tannerellaceae bacterium]|nr:alpha/beta hydrolase [Tannerellaceae bacterium]